MDSFKVETQRLVLLAYNEAVGKAMLCFLCLGAGPQSIGCQAEGYLDLAAKDPPAPDVDLGEEGRIVALLRSPLMLVGEARVVVLVSALKVAVVFPIGVAQLIAVLDVEIALESLNRVVAAVVARRTGQIQREVGGDVLVVHVQLLVGPADRVRLRVAAVETVRQGQARRRAE